MPEATTPPTSSTAPAKDAGQKGRGQGGQQMGRRKAPKSRYGVQMQEKQTFKGIFGIREQQLRKYYAQALRSKEQTGELLVQLLESRLDNAVYRAGLAPTRRAARQLTSHRYFAVNGKAVDIASYQLRPGDMVSIRETKRAKAPFANFAKRMQNVHTPPWLTLDVEGFGFKVHTQPSMHDANLGVDVQAIVEYFAR